MLSCYNANKPMEVKPEPVAEKKEETPKPESQASDTVVNVVAPPSIEASVKDQSPAIPPPVAQPVQDVQDKPEPTEKQLPQATEKPKKPPKPVTFKKETNGVMAAIVATVVIVLGLAVLAVYAYIKTK
jgi:hypothetical protein